MIIGEVTGETGYAGLVAALPFRLDELGTTLETVDEIAGLPGHYTAKLLAPSPMRGLGRISPGVRSG